MERGVDGGASRNGKDVASQSRGYRKSLQLNASDFTDCDVIDLGMWDYIFQCDGQYADIKMARRFRKNCPSKSLL